MTSAAVQPVTLFTGQWTDLPLEGIPRLASGWGYDGLEIACSGEHLDVWRAAEDDAYDRNRLNILDRHGLKVWALSNHLTGEVVCDDPIDVRHKAILRPRVWGDGDPEGVRTRAAEELALTAKVARTLGVEVVTGFTGSEDLALRGDVPARPGRRDRRGYEDSPAGGVQSSTRSTRTASGSPTRCIPVRANDYWTCRCALEAIGRRPAFGLSRDTSLIV